MAWHEEYERKRVSPEEAVKVIKSGDTVVIPIDTEPRALSKALMNRRSELEDVTIMFRQPRDDCGWFKEEVGSPFRVVLDTQAGSGTEALVQKTVDYIPFLTSLRFRQPTCRPHAKNDVEVAMVVVSTPDENGYCSFGLYLSHKRDYARMAKTVLAEVSQDPEMQIRTSGDNQIHVSEIDFFVEHVSIPHPVGKEVHPDAADRTIAEYVSTLIRDGDTVQLGPGGTITALLALGGLDGKNDLGIHSAILTEGMLDLVRKGVVTGRRKNVNPNLSVSGGFWRIDKSECLNFIKGNRHFLIRDMSYVNDLRVIASHDNMVAINSVLTIDLTGQLGADSLGTRMREGAGGQVEFVMGAILSKGGRSITVLPSTGSSGTISRIVPTLEPGTVVSIPRTFCDYVVTEYGIASLWGKSQRQRVSELISIAHPDFRLELKKEADRLY